MSEKKNRFADRLGQLRAEKQLTLEELGKVFGKSRATMGHYQNGLRSPDIDDLIAMARFFGVSVSYLVGDSDVRDIEVYHESVNGHDLAISYRSEAYPDGFSHADAEKVIAKLESIGINIEDLLK